MTRTLLPNRLMLKVLISNKTPHHPGCSFIPEECISCDCFKATAVALLKQLDAEAKTDDRHRTVRG